MAGLAHEPAAVTAIASVRRLVVKVGSALLVDADKGTADHDWAAALARDVARFRARGQEVLIVSSGSIALGRRRLRLPLGGRMLLEEKQAAAAAGQSLLMRVWEEAFAPHALTTAQILLTRNDTEVRRRWLNARSTFETLLRLGAIPVVNENDSVATEEIRYGDNDRLAARVAQMVGADVLVLLSDVDGLYSADPRREAAARHIPVVAAVTAEMEAMAGAANGKAGVGTGGMATKLAAARIAQGAGCATLIALGRTAEGCGPLEALEAGARHTVVEPHATPAAAYKQWIAGALAPRGALVIDAGAAAALRAGKSLLPAGVRAVEGAFDKGDAVRILEASGREAARGLAGYEAREARAILGLRSDAIEAALGYRGRPTMVHRNDLVLTRAGESGGGVDE